eukprot:TRINITY_DN5184_c0_g1_i2.p1 TRINITY_DN5184_c0_g1~~TRINITY_DN5184_c0_g1_i2.p1  ORF type:complete len:345 (-),score=97.64 TRINITY_DN5184_c0_g1_i2:18-1052(-)
MSYYKRAIDVLSRYQQKDRITKLNKVLNGRTRGLTVVLENIIDPGNAAAVLRTVESHGIQDVHLIESWHNFNINSEITKGCDRWMTIHRYKSPVDCLEKLKKDKYAIWSSCIGEESISIQSAAFPRIKPIDPHQAAATLAAAAATKPFEELMDPKDTHNEQHSFMREALDRVKLHPFGDLDPKKSKAKVRSVAANAAAAAAAAVVSVATGPLTTAAATVAGPLAAAVAAAASGPLSTLAGEVAADSLNHVNKLAIVFGNENRGVSKYMKQESDGLFELPMRGMSQSYNISASVAISMAYLNSWGGIQPDLSDEEKEQILFEWLIKSTEFAKKILEKEGLRPDNY